MYYTQSIESQTLELIKSLQGKNYLKDFHLVGGTALAIYLGHRKSVDIDLFSNFNFDTSVILEAVQQDYSFQILNISPNTIKGIIDNVSVDIIAHRYPYLKLPVVTEGIRLLSMDDQIAMKLNAICTSGQRSKDFIDVFYALNRYDISDMIGFYQKKYAQEGDSHVIKSLIYFDDTDLSDWPLILKNKNLQWKDVKTKIEKEVLRFIKERS